MDVSYFVYNFPIIGGWQHNRQEGRDCQEIPRGGTIIGQDTNARNDLHIVFPYRVEQKLTSRTALVRNALSRSLARASQSRKRSR